MKSNILGIVFTILSGVLIVMIILAYERSDREEPEFRFSALNLTYDSDTTDNDLIDGMMQLMGILLQELWLKRLY